MDDVDVPMHKGLRLKNAGPTSPSINIKTRTAKERSKPTKMSSRLVQHHLYNMTTYIHLTHEVHDAPLGPFNEIFQLLFLATMVILKEEPQPARKVADINGLGHTVLSTKVTNVK